MKPDPALVRFDRVWGDFLRNFEDPVRNASRSNQDIDGLCDLPTGTLDKLANASCTEWRASPSKSMLNALRRRSLAQTGDTIFEDLTEQTRFILMACRSGFLSSADVVRGDRNHLVMVARDAPARKPHPEQVGPLNNLVRALYAYAARNEALVVTKQIKLPKKLYRGIRHGDLAIDTSEAVKAFRADNQERYAELDHARKSTYLFDCKARVEATRSTLTSKPLAELSHSPILSFTASRKIAEYFADARGFVIEIDTSDMPMRVVTSHKHEEVLAGSDAYTRKQEQEWILDIGSGTLLLDHEVAAQDVDYAMAINSPLSVGLFRNSHVEAVYEMSGHQIVAGWYWKRQNSGGLLFNVDGGYLVSAREARQTLGFSPLPSEANLDQISGFTLYKRDRWKGRLGLLPVHGEAAMSGSQEEELNASNMTF